MSLCYVQNSVNTPGKLIILWSQFIDVLVLFHKIICFVQDLCVYVYERGDQEAKINYQVNYHMQEYQ